MFRIRTAIVMDRKAEPEIVDIIDMVNLCVNVGQLPRAGGVFDQDSYVMFLIEFVLTCQQERAALDAKRSHG